MLKNCVVTLYEAKKKEDLDSLEVLPERRQLPNVGCAELYIKTMYQCQLKIMYYFDFM